MYGLGHIKSPILHSYQIVFLLLGLLTFFVGTLRSECLINSLFSAESRAHQLFRLPR